MVIFGICLAPSLLIAVGADLVVQTLFGPEFVGSTPVLRLLILGIPFIALTGVAAHVMFAVKKAGITTTITGFSLLINVGLSFLFVPIHGPKGAATATLVALLINAGIHAASLAYVTRRYVT
jgi:O-antigen/teichoic acid export membrane protein